MEFNTIVDLIFLTLGIMVLIPCLMFFVECLAAFVSTFPSFNPENVNPQGSAIASRPRTTILIPAHNEAEQIVNVIQVLQTQLTEQDRVIVIADNCHDDTAELARATKVEVLEREHKTDRGKGYALDYAIKYMLKNNIDPEVLVILDGDCIVKPDTIKNITSKAIATGRPVQATYLMEQPDNPSLKDRVSMFSIKVKNQVRLLGLNRLGWHSLLTGSGMAFPWSLINDAIADAPANPLGNPLGQVSLAGSKTTDDMQLTVDLALAGSTPVFCEHALVMGRLMKDKDAQSQRSRWEHGHLEMIGVEVPRLLKAFIKTKNLAALGLALDILIPPLSLLVMIWMASMIGFWLVALGTSVSSFPAVIVTIAGGLLLTGVLLAWSKFGRADLPLKNLIAIPFYILGKIPIYLNFLVKPQSRWLKTERDLPNNH
ncbi:MAG: glycosyltransferase family 2 protein [Pleurocapsa minor HA4230-MV1]|jgi:cellulose synthase/poly-beta-1,6-N-acetylglucosamine synthase-like glycosyltransferase|nr:glycosyltransferase family 2 protein [Pleurocapsa minor HA4230-MV1]